MLKMKMQSRKKAWGGCEMREAAAGDGNKLKSIEDFNLEQTDDGNKAATSLNSLKKVLEEFGAEKELFDQVIGGISEECGGSDEHDAIAQNL